MGHWCDMHLSLQCGDTPLMEASGRGHDGCVRLLLDRGAQIDHQNKVSISPVSLYIMFSCVKRV